MTRVMSTVTTICEKGKTHTQQTTDICMGRVATRPGFPGMSRIYSMLSRQDQPRDAKCPGFQDADKTQNDNNNNNTNNNNTRDSSNLIYMYKYLSYRRETALQGGLVMAKMGDNILRTLYGLSFATMT